MARIPTAPLLAAGLIGGFELARLTGRRGLGGAAFAVAGAAAAREWAHAGGSGRAVPLTALYGAAMGGSHPLAHRLGARRAVAVVTAVSAGTAYAVHDRRA